LLTTLQPNLRLVSSSACGSQGYCEYIPLFSAGNPNDVLINSSPFIMVNNSYYYFSTQSVNWFAAHENCRKMGSNLVTFETPEEFDSVMKYLLNLRIEENKIHMYWTSGNDLGWHTMFKWFSSGEVIKIKRWAPGQPDNYQGKEHCVAVGYDDTNRLHDSRCEYLKKYICEAPKQETISIVIWK
ncbi:hypothetical protein KR018_005679, partial [Drosophila ironensis]